MVSSIEQDSRKTRALNAESRLQATPQAAALDILENYWADSEGRVNFPIDPVAIAKKLSAEVVLAELESEVSGLLVKDAGESKAKIYLSVDDNERRQRFTCTHEIGHLVHRNADKSTRVGYIDNRDLHSSSGKNPDEVWANQFAAELLMPGAAVRNLWAKGQSIARMARVFGVSQEAMNIRLSRLGLS